MESDIEKIQVTTTVESDIEKISITKTMVICLLSWKLNNNCHVSINKLQEIQQMWN